MNESKTGLRAIAAGALTMSSVNILRLLVQFVSLPILARLLSPEDYGLAAMAMPLILFVMMIADGGLGNSLIRTDKTEGHEWDTCFWVSCVLGSILTLATASVSPFAASILGQPRLMPIVATLSVIVLAQTIQLIPAAALQKASRFGTTAAIEISALLLGISTAVVLAVMKMGVWALVWQQIVFYGVRLTLILIFSSYRPRLIFKLKDTWEHVVFGWHILGSNIVTFTSRSIENLVIGKYIGPAPLGIYAMASQFARLPFMLVTGPLQHVLYPQIVMLRQDRKKMKELFLLITRMLAIVITPSVVLVAAASKPIFHFLLSSKWADAAPIFMLIAPAAALQSVAALQSTFLMALGRTDVQMRLAIKMAVFWLAGLAVSVSHGIAAVAGAYTVFSLVFVMWSLYVSLPLIGCSFAEYVRALVWPVVLSLAGVLGYVVAGKGMEGTNPANIAIAAALTLAAIAAAAFIQKDELKAALFFSPSKQ
jgi:PST family polysaccharide transporter